MTNLLHKIDEVPKDKKLIVFDLDGTLAESKTDIDEEMVGLLEKLLEKRLVAVIGGGKYELFQHQLISKLSIQNEFLEKLYLFPTTATAFYRYDNKWQQVYSIKFSEEEKKKIFDAFEKVFGELNYHPDEVYWKTVEDRDSEITFSALGQNAPLDLKEAWKKENSDLKFKMVEMLQKHLPNMEVRAAGYTSIDVTRKGIDKEYGLNKIKEYLKIDFRDMLFVGDSIFEGGNDSAALSTGVLCFEVKNPRETKKLIRHILED